MRVASQKPSNNRARTSRREDFVKSLDYVKMGFGRLKKRLTALTCSPARTVLGHTALRIQSFPRFLRSCASVIMLCACALPAQAQQYTEVKVTSSAFADIEFDSARDGLYCATCNFGQGNARFNWTDKTGNLWLGHVDWQTGAFLPTTGQAELVDTNAAFWKDFGNGPEWAFSQQGSQLVYTRYAPGMPRTTANAGAALATMVNGVWTADFLPGAIGSNGISGPINSVLPLASQASSDPVAYVVYNSMAVPQTMFWEQASLSDASPNLTPFGAYANGISERWVPQTHQLLFLGSAVNQSTGQAYEQVYWYGADSNTVVQLTTDPSNKNDAFLFQAPEFNDSYVFFTVANNNEIDVYKQTGFASGGRPTFQLINRITSTDPAEPLIASAEPFVNCSPTCKTYIFMTLTGTPKLPQNNPNGLAVTNIDPAHPRFTVLATAASAAVQRSDPEYFITAQGPYLYYIRVALPTATTPAQYQGEFYIDMQLGAPMGPCVGSSAEGGLLPGC
jgi:hypothetical protein